MPDSKEIVINTSPLLALSAALGDLSLLKLLYQQVFVPFEVCRGLEKNGLLFSRIFTHSLLIILLCLCASLALATEVKQMQMRLQDEGYVCNS